MNFSPEVLQYLDFRDKGYGDYHPDETDFVNLHSKEIGDGYEVQVIKLTDVFLVKGNSTTPLNITDFGHLDLFLRSF